MLGSSAPCPPGPSGGLAPDYLISFQCGFILRLFANPASEGYDFAGQPHRRDRAIEHGLAVVTRNVSNFRAAGVPLVNPFER